MTLILIFPLRFVHKLWLYKNVPLGGLIQGPFPLHHYSLAFLTQTLVSDALTTTPQKGANHPLDSASEQLIIPPYPNPYPTAPNVLIILALLAEDFSSPPFVQRWPSRDDKNWPPVSGGRAASFIAKKGSRWFSFFFLLSPSRRLFAFSRSSQRSFHPDRSWPLFLSFLHVLFLPLRFFLRRHRASYPPEVIY